MATNGNDTAFPVLGPFYSSRVGVTKRELFAALAMMGMAMRVREVTDCDVAFASVSLADALIAELSKAAQ